MRINLFARYSSKKLRKTFLPLFFLSAISLFSTEIKNIKADSLLKIARSYIDLDLDSAIFFSLKCAQKAVIEKDTLIEAKAYMNMGLANDFKGNYAEAIRNYKITLEKFTLRKDIKGMGIASNLIGIAYYHISDYSKATQYYKNAIKYFENAGYKEGVAAVYNGMGVLYSDMNDYANALEYYNKSLQLKRQFSDTIAIINSLVNIADIETHYTKNFKKVIDLLNEAENMSLLKKNERMLGTVYDSKANVYIFQRNYKEALKFAQQALDINNRLDNTKGICYDYILLSKSHYYLANKNKAYQLLFDALDLAIKHEIKIYIKDIYEQLSQFYAEDNDYSKAFYYQSLYINIKDSVFSEQNRRTIEDLKVSYETEKMEQQINLLNEERKVLDLQKANERNARYALILVAVLLLLLLFFIFYRYKLKLNTEKVLSEKNAELQTSNATKDKLFAVVSHDLKNPVMAFQSITSSIHANYDNLPAEKIKELLQKMKHTSSQLNGFLINILNWAKSQQNNIFIQKQKVDIKQLVADIATLYKTEIDQKKIQFINKTNGDIYCDKDILHLVLRNIIHNAIKFVKENEGLIEIQNYFDSNIAYITVKDNGMGIAQEHLNKLFKIEEDVSSIGDSSNKGSGLGLVLSKELIQKTNGDITVESDLNKGTTFFIKIVQEA